MEKLISAEQLLKKVEETKGRMSKETVKNIIQEAPGLRVAFANWLEREKYWECEHCGLKWALNAGKPLENGMNFCPGCGAIMDKEIPLIKES